MIDAVVLGCWENGYGIIRQLARERLKIAAVFAKEGETWRHSRYLAERHQIPNPAERPEALVDFLLSQAGRWRGALLIPTNDHYVEILSRRRDSLAPHYAVLAADYPVVQNLLDKSQLYRIAGSLGIAAPATHYYDSPEALASDPSGLAFPCLVKPVEGHRFFEAYGRKLFFARNAGELIQHFTDAFAKGLRVGVQEITPGPDTNLYAHVSYTAEDGTMLFEGVRRKLRQNPAHFGVARASKTEWHPEVAQLSRRLLQALNYRGICGLEFKQDARNKQWVVLDANARFPLTHMAMDQAGVNLAYLIYQDRVRGIRRPVTKPREGVYWINLNADIRNTFLMRNNEKLTVKGWLEPYLHEHVFADLDWRDPVPFILRMGWLAEWLTRRVIQRISRLFAARRPSCSEGVESVSAEAGAVKETC